MEWFRQYFSPDSEEEQECRVCKRGPAAGRLISPCLCVGHVRYIHANCMKGYMQAEAATIFSSSTRCPHCLYSYGFWRPYVANFLRSSIVRAILMFAALPLCLLFTGALIARYFRLNTSDWTAVLLGLAVMSAAGSTIDSPSSNLDESVRRVEAYSLRLHNKYRSASPLVSWCKMLAHFLLDALKCALLLISTILEIFCLWIENVRADRKRSGHWW